MTPMRTSIRLAAASTAFGLVVVSNSLGVGFRNPDQDARATAQGEAYVAQADSPSAVYYNPGGLTQLQGTEMSSGGFITFRDIQFDGKTSSADLNDPAYTAHS